MCPCLLLYSWAILHVLPLVFSPHFSHYQLSHHFDPFFFISFHPLTFSLLFHSSFVFLASVFCYCLIALLPSPFFHLLLISHQHQFNKESYVQRPSLGQLWPCDENARACRGRWKENVSNKCL